ncbi:MAG: hypothetical protein FWG34_05300 [Oscillospiraceae bacterium]|jgi:hypothetical protein|nr:hypothetical protein [Oscillospiraceae bacterium]
MSNDLTKRYIYAVICHLPAKSQPEVEKEIESMISELLEARCGESQPKDEDIRAVLGGLGAPEELAAKYSGDENKALISGIYLIWFKKILKIVLPVAAAGVAFATLLSAFVKWQPPREMYEFIAEMVAGAISGALSAAVHAFMCVTLVFVIMERKKVKLSGDDFLSKLQPVPDKRAQIKVHEPVIGILWHIAAAALLLGFPYLIGGYTESTGWIPVFDEKYIQSAWYLVVLWAAFGTFREAVKLIDRRYSKRVAITTLAAHILAGISAVLFFANSSIMNPVFVDNAKIMIKGADAEKIGGALGYANLFVLAITLFSLLLEIGLTIYRAIRYDK